MCNLLNLQNIDLIPQLRIMAESYLKFLKRKNNNFDKKVIFHKLLLTTQLEI